MYTVIRNEYDTQCTECGIGDASARYCYTVCRHFSPTSDDIGDIVVAFNFLSFSSKWGLARKFLSFARGDGGDEKRKKRENGWGTAEEKQGAKR